ncbi:MAG: protein-glutamine glutaminase family protein [Panacibacter sp.]
MWPQYFLTGNNIPQETYEFSEIKKAFDDIIQCQIDFYFPQGGCQQRAQIMSLILQKKFAIEHCKIWLFAPAALYEGDTRTLFIEDKNKLSPNNTVEWSYHTAPAVLVKSGDAVETFIIDPSINKNEPLRLEEWFSQIGNSSISNYTYVRAENYFFNCRYNENNELTNIFDGTFFEFMNPVKDNLLMEKGLAVNDMAMQVFHTYIKPLMDVPAEENETRLADLKEIFGNSTALDLLFSQNMSGYTEHTSHRYVITHYSTIIQEAKTIFNQRLDFWTRFSNTLL